MPNEWTATNLLECALVGLALAAAVVVALAARLDVVAGLCALASLVYCRRMGRLIAERGTAPRRNAPHGPGAR